MDVPNAKSLWNNQSPQTSIQQVTPPRFAQDLFAGRREDYFNYCVPLYQASLTGDLETAKAILNQFPALVRSSITEDNETALHIAASANNTNFVRFLVQLMDQEDLELRCKNGNTALCLVAAAGYIEMAEIMVSKNRGLVNIPGSQGMMPICMAALFAKRDMVYYLYNNSEKMSGASWTPHNRGWVLLTCVEADLFDIAIKILEDHPELAQSGSLLGVLARKPEAFCDIKPKRTINSSFPGAYQKVKPRGEESDAMILLRIIWKSIQNMPKDDIDTLLKGPHDMKDGKPVHSSPILFVAAELGNTKFIVELIRYYPDLIWKLNDNNQTIFHIAISFRHEDIYNLLYEIGSMKDMITSLTDSEGNNMLHLVGKNVVKNQNTKGVAFQMRRELLWFKEVEAMIPPSCRNKKNAAGLTPYQQFTMNHENLVSRGEKWMKGIASQCIVAAALVATIVFGVAFTMPGGYHQDTGYPMFAKKTIFIVFITFDAISFILASASILIFLSILASSYAPQDFLLSLPAKLLLGIATLFLSTATMMIAFSISFYVLYRERLILMSILISVVTATPIILYSSMGYPLLMDLFNTTYRSRFLFMPKKRMLYNQTPRF